MVKEGKDKNEVMEGNGKNEVMEGFGKMKRTCEGISISGWIGTLIKKKIKFSSYCKYGNSEWSGCKVIYD